MEGSVSIAVLCAEHAVLATELVDLDRRIQALSGTYLEGTPYDAITRSAVASITKADILWLQLDDILRRQDAIVVALIDQAASNTGELRDKGQTFAALLRTNRPMESDLAQALSLSLVRDIITLFPQHDSAAPDQGATCRYRTGRTRDLRVNWRLVDMI
jgi:hypothetical protein